MKKGRTVKGILCLLSAAVLCPPPLFSAVETQSRRIIPEQKPGKPTTAKEEKKKPSSEAPTDVIPSSLGDIQALVIPEAFGTIKEIFRGARQDAFIFHIQDVHANPEVQENMARILDHVNRAYFGGSIELVATEGARGEVDLEPLRGFPDDKARREACAYLIGRGLMTGDEYYAAHFQHESRLVGVEDGPLYFDNLRAFRDTMKASRENEAAAASFENALARVSEKMLSPELKEFYLQQENYRGNKLPLTQYCLFLQESAGARGVELKDLGNLRTALDSIALEKTVEFKKMEREQLRLLSELQTKGTKEQTAALVGKSVELRTGKLNPADYYDYLMQSARDQKLDVAKQFPEVEKYAGLVRMQSKIRTAELLADIRSAETRVKEKLLVKAEEKKFDQIREDWELLSKLRRLGMSRDEWMRFSERESGFDLAGWRRFVEEEATKQGVQAAIPAEWDRLPAGLAPAKKFYEDAIRRDAALTKNFFDELEKREAKSAFIITGGFHTAALTRQLKAKDISYAVITPRLTRPHDDALYHALMMGETPALKAYSRFENELMGEENPFAEEVARAADGTARLAFGSLLLSLTDPSVLPQPAYAAWLTAAGINVVSVQVGRQAEFIYGPSDNRRRARVALVETAPGQTRLVASLVGEEPGISPLAFQGGLGPAIAADFGAARSNRNGVEDSAQIQAQAAVGARPIRLGNVPLAVDARLAVELAGALGITDAAAVELLQNEVFGKAFAALSSEGQTALTQGLTRERKGEPVILGLLDRSPNLFEDHRPNGFVGVNRGLFAAFRDGKISRDVLILALQTGFIHELRHEAATEAAQTGVNELAFEAQQVPQDVALFFALAGDRLDRNLLASLAQIVDVRSAFFSTLSSVAAAFDAAAPGTPLRAAFAEVGADLVIADRRPSASETPTLSAVGALTKLMEGLVLPTLIVDVDQFDPAELQKLAADLRGKLKAGEQVLVVLSAVEPATETELNERFAARAAGISVEGLRVVASPRAAGATPQDYVQAIYELVKGQPNIRILTNAENFDAFYKYLNDVLSFVQTLLRDRNDVEIVMTRAEYDNIRQALREVGGPDAQRILDILKFEQRGSYFVLTLPAQFIADSKAMDALLKARAIIAKQA